MLPNLRFVIGAMVTAVLLGVTGLGLFATAWTARPGKVGPLEASRNVPFDDRADWNQFNDPDGARRFEELARKAAPASSPVDHITETAPDVASLEPNATITPADGAPTSAPPERVAEAAPPAIEAVPAAATPSEPASEKTADLPPPPTTTDVALPPTEAPPPATPFATAAVPVPVATDSAKIDEPKSDEPKIVDPIADPPKADPPTTAPAIMTQTSPPPDAPAAQPATANAPAEEPRETGALPPANTATVDPPEESPADEKALAEGSWDQEPLMVDEAPPATDQVANAPAATPDVGKAEEPLPPPSELPLPAATAPLPPAPLPPAAAPRAPAPTKPAITAPVRRPPPQPRAVERDDDPPPRPAPAPRPRVVRPAQQPTQQYGQSSYGDEFSRQPYQSQQHYAPRPQYAPQEYRQPTRRDPYSQPYNSRGWPYGG